MKEIMLVTMVVVVAILCAAGSVQIRDRVTMPEYVRMVEENRAMQLEFSVLPVKNDLLR